MAADVVTLYYSYMNTPMIKAHEEIVRMGGGEYIGTVDGLVYFNSPKTGSTLARKENLLTSESVKSRIAESNLTFEK